MRYLLPGKFLTALFLFGLCCSVSQARGQEANPESASDVKPENIKVNGVVEAIVAVEVSADTEQIESLEIKKIVPHGTKVNKGQNIVWFETEDIDKKVKDAETELRLAQLTLDDDEFNYEQFIEKQKLDRAAAQRARKQAQQSYDNFVQVDRERQGATAEYNLKSSKASLENAMEELEQLEQMYKEDDLTEESEEIVLKRARQSVEFAQYRLEGTEITSARAVKQDIPRAQAQQEDSLARAEMAHQKSIRELNSARQRQDIEMGQKRDKFKEQKEKFAELKEERKRVVLTSPIDGILIHGKLTRGKLSDKPSTLEEGSKVTPSQIVATVVDPGKLQIRVDLEEKNLPVVTRGTKCTIRFNAHTDFETKGTVKSVSDVPYAGTKYDCVVAIGGSKKQPKLMPTMTCELEFEAPKSDKSEVTKKETKQNDASQNENEKSETPKQDQEDADKQRKKNDNAKDKK